MGEEIGVDGLPFSCPYFLISRYGDLLRRFSIKLPTPPLAALPDDDRRPQRDDSTCAASLSCIASDTIAALPSVAYFLYFMISISCRILFPVAVCFFMLYSNHILVHHKKRASAPSELQTHQRRQQKKYLSMTIKKPRKSRMLHHDRQHVDDERREKSIRSKRRFTYAKTKL